MPPTINTTARALVLARELLAVLPAVPDLPNGGRRLAAAGSLVLDLDVLAMLAVPPTAESARIDVMIALDPQKQRKRAGRRREVRPARHAAG
jgi:hypothetical protein